MGRKTHGVWRERLDAAPVQVTVCCLGLAPRGASPGEAALRGALDGLAGDALAGEGRLTGELVGLAQPRETCGSGRERLDATPFYK